MKKAKNIKTVQSTLKVKNRLFPRKNNRKSIFVDKNFVYLQDFVSAQDAVDEFEAEFEDLRASDMKREYKAAKTKYDREQEVLAAQLVESSESGVSGLGLSSDLGEEMNIDIVSSSSLAAIISSQLRPLVARMETLEKQQAHSDHLVQRTVNNLVPQAARERAKKRGDVILAGPYQVAGTEVLHYAKQADMSHAIRSLFDDVFKDRLMCIFREYQYYKNLPDTAENPLKTAFNKLLGKFLLIY